MADLLQAPVDPYLQPNTEELLTLVREKRTKWKNNGRDAWLGNAYLNLLFERGHQWLVYDVQKAQWFPREPPQARRRSRRTSSRLRCGPTRPSWPASSPP